eukprot:scaffold912_cov187-Ochromonas_danica.AAC.14
METLREAIRSLFRISPKDDYEEVITSQAAYPKAVSRNRLVQLHVQWLEVMKTAAPSTVREEWYLFSNELERLPWTTITLTKLKRLLSVWEQVVVNDSYGHKEGNSGVIEKQMMMTCGSSSSSSSSSSGVDLLFLTSLVHILLALQFNSPAPLQLIQTRLALVLQCLHTMESLSHHFLSTTTTMRDDSRVSLDYSRLFLSVKKKKKKDMDNENDNDNNMGSLVDLWKLYFRQAVLCDQLDLKYNLQVDVSAWLARQELLFQGHPWQQQQQQQQQQQRNVIFWNEVVFSNFHDNNNNEEIITTRGDASLTLLDDLHDNNSGVKNKNDSEGSGSSKVLNYWSELVESCQNKMEDIVVLTLMRSVVLPSPSSTLDDDNNNNDNNNNLQLLMQEQEQQQVMDWEDPSLSLSSWCDGNDDDQQPVSSQHDDEPSTTHSTTTATTTTMMMMMTMKQTVSDSDHHRHRHRLHPLHRLHQEVSVRFIQLLQKSSHSIVKKLEKRKMINQQSLPLLCDQLHAIIFYPSIDNNNNKGEEESLRRLLRHYLHPCRTWTILLILIHRNNSNAIKELLFFLMDTIQEMLLTQTKKKKKKKNEVMEDKEEMRDYLEEWIYYQLLIKTSSLFLAHGSSLLIHEEDVLVCLSRYSDILVEYLYDHLNELLLYPLNLTTMTSSSIVVGGSGSGSGVDGGGGMMIMII